MQESKHVCGPAPGDSSNSGSCKQQQALQVSGTLDESADGNDGNKLPQSDSSMRADVVTEAHMGVILKDIGRELDRPSRTPLHVDCPFKVVLHVPLSPLVDHVIMTRHGQHQWHVPGSFDDRRRMSIHSSALVRIAVDGGNTHMAKLASEVNEELQCRLKKLEDVHNNSINGNIARQPVAPMDGGTPARGARARHGAHHTAVTARLGLQLLDKAMVSASVPIAPVSVSAHCVCGQLRSIPGESGEADVGTDPAGENLWVLLCDGVGGLDQRCKYGQAFHATCLGIDADTAQRIADGQRQDEPRVWRCEPCSTAALAAELSNDIDDQAAADIEDDGGEFSFKSLNGEVPPALRAIQHLHKLKKERDVHDNALQSAARECGDVDPYTLLTEPVACELRRYYKHDFGLTQHGALYDTDAAGRAGSSGQAFTSLLVAAFAIDDAAMRDDVEIAPRSSVSTDEPADDITRTERFLAYMLAPHRVSAYAPMIVKPDIGIVNRSVRRRMAVYLPAFQHFIKALEALVEAKWAHVHKYEKYSDKVTVKQMTVFVQTPDQKAFVEQNPDAARVLVSAFLYLCRCHLQHCEL